MADKRCLEIPERINAMELENMLHAWCDHHGWDIEVVVKGRGFENEQEGE